MTPQESVDRALAAASTRGRGEADGTMVLATATATANLRWANNSLTTNGATTGHDLTVISVVDGGVGVVTRTVASPDQVGELVGQAEQAARDAGPAEDARPLVGPDEVPAGTGGDFTAEAAGTGIDVFADLAPALGTAFGQARGAGRRLFGFAEHTTTTHWLGSSTGLRLRTDAPVGRLELNAKSDDGSVWAGRSTRDFGDVDVASVTAELDGRLDWCRRRVDLPAGRYETLLPPSAVADLMIYLYWSASGRDAADGRTVFSAPTGTRIGERLATLPLTLTSDPADPVLATDPFVLTTAGSATTSVFDNGLPTRRVDWISGGVLENLVHSRHSAGLTGGRFTPAVGNLDLRLDGATGDLQSMVASTKRGLLLTCLWYIREVDPQTLLLTGLTRDGVFLVEDGEVVGAVNNFRFNVSPVAMLERVTEAGTGVQTLPREWNDWFTLTRMPPLRVEGFNMSTVSQAS